MQELKLASHLMGPVEIGDKKMTIRKGVREITVGTPMELVNADDPQDKIEVNVVGAEIRELRQVPDRVAQEDGFVDLPDLYRGLRNFYPDIDWLDKVTVIRFELRQ